MRIALIMLFLALMNLAAAIVLLVQVIEWYREITGDNGRGRKQ